MSFLSDYDRLSMKLSLHDVTRFDSYFDIYGLSLAEADDAEHRTVTLIAKSPASAPAEALAINLQRFEPGSIAVAVILAHIAPAQSLAFLLQSLRDASRLAPEICVRWAKNRALLDAHERLTLGRSLCWTGDSMRRSDDSRSALDRVEEESPLMLAEARASFAAIWKASMELPKGVIAHALNELPSRPGTPAADPFQPELTGELGAPRIDETRTRRH